MSVSFAPKHYLPHDHEGTDLFGRASQGSNYLPDYPGGDYSKTIQQQLLPQERCDPGPSASFIYGSSALPKVLLHNINSRCAALSHIGWLFQDSQTVSYFPQEQSFFSFCIKKLILSDISIYQVFKKIFVDQISTVTISCYSKLI